jgi:hypothetical protein
MKLNNPPLLKTPPLNPLSSFPIRAFTIPKTRFKKAVCYMRRHLDDVKLQVERDYKISRNAFVNAFKRVNQEPRVYGSQNKGLTIV